MKNEKERIKEIFLKVCWLTWEIRKLYDMVYNIKQEIDKEDDENKGKGGWLKWIGCYLRTI